MNKWNKVDPYNLDYIKKQVEEIKDKQNISNNKETEKVETRKIEDILEEQLSVLKQMKHTLEKLDSTASQKGWKRLF